MALKSGMKIPFISINSSTLWLDRPKSNGPTEVQHDLKPGDDKTLRLGVKFQPPRSEIFVGEIWGTNFRPLCGN